MIRCLCTGAASLAQLISPSDTRADLPPAVEAFLSGAALPARNTDDARSERTRPSDG